MCRACALRCDAKMTRVGCVGQSVQGSKTWIFNSRKKPAHIDIHELNHHWARMDEVCSNAHSFQETVELTQTTWRKMRRQHGGVRIGTEMGWDNPKKRPVQNLGDFLLASDFHLSFSLFFSSIFS